MTQKYITIDCRFCGKPIEVRTNNEWMHCEHCQTSNCKNPDAYETDEDRYLEAVEKSDNRYETEW